MKLGPPQDVQVSSVDCLKHPHCWVRLTIKERENGGRPLPIIPTTTYKYSDADAEDFYDTAVE